MTFDASKLETRIRAILQSPGIDLATISAKRVRKQLQEQDPSLTADVVKDNKEEIDRIIGQVYEEVSAAQQAEQDGGDEEGGEEENEDVEDVKPEKASSSKPDKKPKKSRKTKAVSADAELARQLSSELNGRPRSAKKAPAPKRGTKRKSAEVVDSDGEGDESVERPKKRGGGFSKEYTLSEPLAALLSAEKMSRPQVVKHLWVHIRGENLQNPSDKREIICDDGMRAVFGVDKMNMFTMNKMLGQHLYEPES
ncbi:hypothetical protein EIP91_009768 [Steccherinum ochraceum]|uniref:Uncharacterized protein n=1 Tax=Steccherinum ochraceum TaxID=92696 RepID=A0A4R0R194_9APHY|nr:hypothetical protein EIP91_009768 [Steccherinum ochraceum]